MCLLSRFRWCLNICFDLLVQTVLSKVESLTPIVEKNRTQKIFWQQFSLFFAIVCWPKYLQNGQIAAKDITNKISTLCVLGGTQALEQRDLKSLGAHQRFQYLKFSVYETSVFSDIKLLISEEKILLPHFLKNFSTGHSL